MKTLFINILMEVIVFLYLLDSEETSFVILLPCGIGLFLTCWKINKACKVTRIPTFPFIKIGDKDAYVDSSTKEYDDLAFKYLSWAMFPLLGGYTIYSLMYNEHKSWYSFVVQTMVGGVYAFGFIMMTP